MWYLLGSNARVPEGARIDLATKIARVGSDDAICATAVPEPIPHFQCTRRLMLLLSHMHVAFSFELHRSVWNLEAQSIGYISRTG